MRSKGTEEGIFGMNKKQIVVVWFALSLLIPITYWGIKSISYWYQKYEYAKEFGAVPLPESQQPYQYKARLALEKNTELFALIVFETVSLAGLVIYQLNNKNKVKE